MSSTSKIKTKLLVALKHTPPEKLSWMICKISKNHIQGLGFMSQASTAPNIDPCLLLQLEDPTEDLLTKIRKLQAP